MTNKAKTIQELELENEQLRNQLLEATAVIDSIREGDVDALVVNDEDGVPQIFAIESADYTYRILIEKFGEGALSVSENGLILFANSYFANLVGLPTDAIAGTHINDYFEERSTFNELFANVQTGPVRAELSLIGKDNPVPVYISFTELRPFVPAIGIVITDLTEKKTQEQALLASQEQLKENLNAMRIANSNLEQVIHVISHDLKEPLRKILTYISQLHNYGETELSTRDAHYLKIIDTAATRLNALLDDIVKYAFISERDDRSRVDLNTVFEQVVDDLEIVIGENEAVVTSQQLPMILGSDVQMRQLFSNLISNAIKYRRDENPTITLKNFEAQVDGASYVCICFEDNGIGMEPGNLEQIFTIFRRLHHRTEYSGNGIGLAICKKIMDNHDGLIKVESHVGQGSTFTLYLPLTRIDERP